MEESRSLRELNFNFEMKPLCIDYPKMDISYELKPGVIHTLPIFHGEPHQDPYEHLQNFFIKCLLITGMPEEQMKLRAFPSTLEGKARDRTHIDGASGGSLTLKTLEEERRLLKTMAENIFQFNMGNEYSSPKPSEQESVCEMREHMNHLDSIISTLGEQNVNLAKMIINLMSVFTSHSMQPSSNLAQGGTNEMRYANGSNNRQGFVINSIGMEKKLKPKKEMETTHYPPPYPQRLYERKRGCYEESQLDSLRLGPMVKTSLTIQLADRTNVYPEGLVEDVLVQVGKLIFPADFYILRMNDEDFDLPHLPLLLGRPFLRTARTKIDVHNGTLSMEFDGEVIKFNIHKAMKFPVEEHSVCATDEIDFLVAQVNSLNHEDDLEMVIMNSLDKEEVKKAEVKLLDTVEDTIHDLESLPEVEEKALVSYVRLEPKPMPLPSIQQPPEVKLKPIPKDLKYAFLGDKKTLPVIISSKLTGLQEEKLIRVLKKYKEALGWMIADICRHPFFTRIL
ncbi:hypothetical protein CCACVL1_11095 [Corchorus capsularis]|uniref:Reverse transcriptase domain-containing protein n=1 Tax=Corchorus capsularis TaxID=210143 RepID=A0A1R3IMU9_COCAP|nr:hypothetical protein CCACVL1_11095 [Corchorus capsularis]